MAHAQQPLDASVLEALKRYDTPTLSNAIETFDVRPRDEGYMGLGVRCMFPDMAPMVGYAATATIRARGEGTSDVQPLYEHVLATPAPRVVVVGDLDDPPAHGAMWGEVNASLFRAMGCVGTVTDGCVRDLDEVHAIGFHFFAAGVGVSHAYQRLVSAGEPVRVGGLVVNPGDVLHADKHGVLVIPREIAAELPAAADAVVAREQALLRWVRSEDFDASQIKEMRSRITH